MKNWGVLMRLLMCVMMVLFLAPATAMAADENGDGYDDGDMAIIQNVIQASATLSETCNVDDPSTWEEYITWNGEGRVTLVNIEMINDFTGELDVSGLDALVTVICANNPGLTSLKLPVGGELSYINCERTAVTALDVSSYTELECLYCSDTGITVLDVSNNTKLKDLFCGNTGIKELDVSKNTELDRLLCSNTDITVLDLSQNPLLTEVQCYEVGIIQLKTKSGHIFTLNQADNGTVEMLEYDPVTETVTLYAQSVSGYVLESWTGIPEDAKYDGNEVQFVVTGDMTVSAVFTVEEVSIPETDSEGAVSEPGMAESETAATKSPKTGDASDVWVNGMFAWLLMIAIGGCVVILQRD